MPRQLSRRGVLAAGGAAAVALAGCTSTGSDDDNGGWDATAPLSVASVRQYSAPGCSCCSKYADYLADAVDGDFSEAVPEDVEAVKREHGVPASLSSCHTVVLDEYLVEGHVPTAAIEMLLDDRPDVDGIAVPGMPSGTPGMGGDRPESLAVYAFGGGRTGDVYVEL
ncbi:DUF411 domain-containing protein [Halobacterium rubrum]|uniref:DUF411 domain-containing protein n=1 Tax=Halobacterium TaxID=2239 RepID=UPI001F28976F|nr:MULTISPECIES: DUF411 domain-containing protein [Halobacterium]MDH5020993.1 DUF411 domain-containing protein [Halobacterium rubrum]